MTNLETLRSLQKRIREATGADRELDCLIALALGVIERFDNKWDDGKYDYGGYRRPGQTHEFIAWSGTWPYSPVYPTPTPRWEAWETIANELRIPFYTTDPDGLGACVALMKEGLPGWKGSVAWGRCDERGSCFASAQVPYGYEGRGPYPEGWGHNNNACLALLDAIVSAKIAEMEVKQSQPEQASSDHKAVKD